MHRNRRNRTVVGGEGGAVRPTPSPDGKKLAYVRREKTRSKLYLRDLEAGTDRKIYDSLDQDLQETWAVTGVYPNMAWTPDSSALIFWAGGKLHKLNVGSGSQRK
jgi:Tol biopolymer transport system component